MSTPPVENLELRAIEQRNELHQSAVELKEKIASTREKLDPSNNLRQRFTAVAIIACSIALLAGYGTGGMITSR